MGLQFPISIGFSEPWHSRYEVVTFIFTITSHRDNSIFFNKDKALPKVLIGAIDQIGNDKSILLPSTLTEGLKVKGHC